MNNDIEQLSEIPIWAWIILGIVLLSQSIYLFFKSRQRGQWKWFWGIWGVTHFPMPLVTYFIWTYWLKSKFKQRGGTRHE
ncbi:sigmaY antisigma factor component [Shouchella sp. JSM 1781072]|uniref:sigmaY antisigma factor component n=1 Tax=Bacillaceae TaxID=186817 RepID=UPI000C07AB9D|nr:MULTISPECIES: sigmaY antisigma factor component [Bacillaceae]UTR07612.1 sigmaY antisigma factor component [Alkalihalobacillus sp. LMS6]